MIAGMASQASANDLGTSADVPAAHDQAWPVDDSAEAWTLAYSGALPGDMFLGYAGSLASDDYLAEDADTALLGSDAKQTFAPTHHPHWPPWWGPWPPWSPPWGPWRPGPWPPWDPWTPWTPPWGPYYSTMGGAGVAGTAGTSLLGSTIGLGAYRF